MTSLLSAAGAPCPGPERRGLDSEPEQEQAAQAQGPFKLPVSESPRRRVRICC